MHLAQFFAPTRAHLISIFGLTLAVGALSATPARAEFDRFVLVQPIVVCDDAGNNCAPVNLYWGGTARALEQASLLPIFLPLSQFNSTALLASNNGPSDFDDTDGGSLDALTINMWFTGLNSIVDCGGTAAIGCANTPGKQIVIDAQSIINEATGDGNPWHRTIAHEIGHNFSLEHVSGAGFVFNLLEVPATFPRSATYDQIGVTRFLLTGDQIDDIRADAKAQTAADCNGTAGVDLITLNATEACLNIIAQGDNDVVTLNAGSGVLQNILGEDGNDIISVLNGSVVGGSVSGGNNDDTITIAGLVLLNVTGDAGNDIIDAQATALIIGDVDGGSGNDTITVASDPANIFGGIGADSITLLAGGVVTNSIFGDDGDGDEADGDAADTILIAGGSVGVSVLGEGGDDQITMTGGTIGANISGGGGADIIIMSAGSVGDDIVSGAGADVIMILGGNVVDGVFGEGEGDAILVAGGSVGGTVSGGTGGDSITLNGGTAGALSGNEGDDFIDVLLGSTGNVAGDADNDRIRVLGGTVTGNVTGGTGNDTILLLEPGTVNGFVDGGADTDSITIASDPTNVFGGTGTDTLNINVGAIITQNVRGDDGNGVEGDGDAADTINLNGGSVGGFVAGEGGADTINLIGTTVGGNLVGGGGGDGFNVSGGSASGIRGDAGDDIAIWTGGVIAFDIAMGADSDRVDVVGPNFGGTADQSGLALLDGGDDASSADGQVDTLNLIGVRGPAVATPTLLAPVTNWEQIFVQSNSLLTLGAASRTIDGELFAIDATSAVFATGVSTFSFGGELRNLGAVDLRDGAANSVVDAAGPYFGGAGSLLFVDTEIGGPGSLSDELRAASSSGVTVLAVDDVLGGLGGFNPDGIVIVRTDAGGSDATHFTLDGGPIDKGLFFYDLLFADSTLANVVVAGVAEDQHVLAGIPDIESFQLGRVAAQAQWAWARSTGVWRDRTADLRDYVSGTGTSGRTLEPGGWARMFGAKADRDDLAEFSLLDATYTYDTSYDVDVFGFMAGADFVEHGVLWGGSGMLGVLVGTSSYEAEFDLASAGPAPTVKGSGPLVGVYATYLDGGLFVDALVKADFPEITLAFHSLGPFGGARDTVDGQSIGGIVDVGYRKFYWREFYTEALGTLSYASTRIDDALLGGSVIDFGSNDSLRGRLGVGLGGQIADIRGAALTARIEASAWHEFDADNTTHILSLGPVFPVSDDAGGTYGEVSGQVTVIGGPSGPSSFVKVDYRFNEEYQDLGVSLGLRVPFGG